MERVAAATAALIRIGQTVQPDMIVGEMFMAGAALAAEVLGVPFAVVGWPAIHTVLPDNAQFVAEEAQARSTQLTQRFAIRGINWAQEGATTLALASPAPHFLELPAGLPVCPCCPRTDWWVGLRPPPNRGKTPGSTSCLWIVPGLSSPWAQLSPTTLISFCGRGPCLVR